MKSEDFTHRSLFESYGLTDPYFKKWEKEIHPYLCEAAVDPTLIPQIFAAAEQGATAAGGNRTLLGKAKDVPGKISDVWFNKFGGMLQSSGPVQAFDAQYDKLVSGIAAKHPDIAAKVKKYQEWAKENPNLQKFLLAIVGSIAAAVGTAAAGGVAAGALAIGTGVAVAVGIVNIADRLLKGDKASSAIGRGATAGAIAGIGAGLTAKIGQMIQGGMHTELVNTVHGNQVASGYFNYNGASISVYGNRADVSAASKAFDKNDWNTLAQLVGKMNDPEYVKSLDLGREIVNQAAQNYEKVSEFTKFLTTAATTTSGAVGTAAVGPGTPAAGAPAPATVAESYFYVDKKRTLFEWSLNAKLGRPRGAVQLTEAGIQKLFQIVEATPNFGVAGAVQPTVNFGTPKPTSAPAAGSLSTAPATPTPTAAAPATPTPTPTAAPVGGDTTAAEPAKPGLLGKAANWLKTKGKNLTTKVTADKLNSAWKTAGEPADSDLIAKVMQDAGVAPEVITQSFQTAGLPAPTIAAAPPADQADGEQGGETPAPKAASGEAPAPASSGGSEMFARQGYAPSGGAPAPTPAGGSAPTDINSVINKTAQTHGMDAAGHPARTGNKADWKAQNRAERTAQTGGRPQAGVPTGSLSTASATPAAPAPAAPAPTAQPAPAAGGAPGFDYKSIQGMLPKAAPALAPKPTPNFAGPQSYGKQTMTVKPMQTQSRVYGGKYVKESVDERLVQEFQMFVNNSGY